VEMVLVGGEGGGAKPGRSCQHLLPLMLQTLSDINLNEIINLCIFDILYIFCEFFTFDTFTCVFQIGVKSIMHDRALLQSNALTRPKLATLGVSGED
jgi:hypothetical protein